MIALIALILLTVSIIIQIVFIFRKKRKNDPLTPFLFASAGLLLLVIILLRSLKIGFLAVTGIFESLVFFSAMIALLSAGLRLQKKLVISPFVILAAAISSFAFLAAATSPAVPKDVLPLIPALRSYWLALHVAFAFVGEAFFVAAFAASAGFLLTKDEIKRDNLDRLAYTSVGIGYPIYTAGALIFGAIWAQNAWGSWWSWDPKETWALITWIAYTLYLHLRLILKRKDAWPSIVCVIGFLCALFTFIGVNFLLRGLHSYS